MDARFRSPPALVRCTANTYEDSAVLEDLGLLNIPASIWIPRTRSTN